VILHDRDAGPAPLRVVRMLAFAADTLRGTALASDAYRGAHRGTAAKNLRWLGTGLLLLGALLGGALFRWPMKAASSTSSPPART
jgi:hypothetical protein